MIIKIREKNKKNYERIPPSAEEFTLLEEIEFLTVEIRGYASQVKNNRQIKNETVSRQKLGDWRFLETPILSNFYFDLSSNYPGLKNYLLQLDYLRLLIAVKSWGGGGLISPVCFPQRWLAKEPLQDY